MYKQTAFSLAGGFSPLEKQLQSYGDLTPAELGVIQACTGALPQSVNSGSAALLDGSVRILANGMVGWVRMLPDGRRQIVEISVPGDVLDPRFMPGAQPVALTKVKTWDAKPLIDGLRVPEHRNLRQVWARAHEARLRRLLEHIMRLGRLSAFERMACFLLDLFERHQRSGLGSGGRIPWPLTQEVLADALGLSIVHLNRTLQSIRRSRLVVLGAGYLDIPDCDRLAEAACRERPASASALNLEDEAARADAPAPVVLSRGRSGV